MNTTRLDLVVFAVLAVAASAIAESRQPLDDQPFPGAAQYGQADVVTNDWKFKVTAVVVGPDEQPVVGALAEVEGTRTGFETSFGGSTSYDQTFTADARGHIEIGGPKPFDALLVTITAPGLAPTKLFLDRTNPLQRINMDAGASIHGRVVKDGNPLADVGMGVSGVERSIEVFAGNFETRTDTNGVFELSHLPKHTDWWFFGQSSSLKERGAIQPRKISTSSAGTMINLGDVEVGQGYRVGGVVRTLDGSPLPKDLAVHVGRDDIWDSQRSGMEKDGAFLFEGMPLGITTVGVQHREWHLSYLNRSLDDWNPFRLIGQVIQDVENLEIIIEPGSYEHRSNSRGELPQADLARNRPLHGAEAAGPPWIRIRGTVVDDRTGETVAVATVTPGYQPPVTAPAAAVNRPLLQRLADSFRNRQAVVPWNERPVWQDFRAMPATNGAFTVLYQPLTSRPILRVEAPGYEPFTSESFAALTNGLIVRLQPGVGPNGIVLTPEGQPATNATVYYGAAGEQFGLHDTTIGYTHGLENSKMLTGERGQFAFQKRPDGRTLFAVHSSGWATREVRDGGDRLKLRLEPWAALAGTLVDSAGAPMPGVELHLTMMNDWQSGNPFPNLQHLARTDVQGVFLFTNVPPGRADIVRYVPMGTGGGWRHQPQTWVEARPGITNEVGTITYDTPPPPSLTDQLKTKLGL